MYVHKHLLDRAPSLKTLYLMKHVLNYEEISYLGPQKRPKIIRTLNKTGQSDCGNKVRGGSGPRIFLDANQPPLAPRLGRQKNQRTSDTTVFGALFVSPTCYFCPILHSSPFNPAGFFAGCFSGPPFSTLPYGGSQGRFPCSRISVKRPGAPVPKKLMAPWILT
jgi:hypothetical protein